MKRILLVIVLAACGGNQEATSPGGKDPCADFELDVQKVWSAGIKAELMGKGGSIQVDERKSIATKMDQLSDDWVRLRTATCRDHFHRKLIDAETYAKRVQCFDDRLDQQRKIVALANSDATAAQKLADGVSANACK